MVDSTRGCDELLGYVYFGKPVPSPFPPPLFTLSLGDGDGRSSNCGDVETVAFLFFSFFCAGRWYASGLYLFILFYDLLVCQFPDYPRLSQIIPDYPSEFNFLLLDFFFPCCSSLSVGRCPYDVDV